MLQRPPVINRIEKIYNTHVFNKFINEFKWMLEKNHYLQIDDMVKHLFHGTGNTQPSKIYTSETGFDLRLAKSAGIYGRGIYFAEDAHYSHNYAHSPAN